MGSVILDLRDMLGREETSYYIRSSVKVGHYNPEDYTDVNPKMIAKNDAWNVYSELLEGEMLHRI